MEREFRVTRKARVQSNKGFKYELTLSNIKGDLVKVQFDEEKELEPYQIQDIINVKITKPQTKLG